MSILLKLKSIATAINGSAFRQTLIDDAITIETEANRVALKVDPQHNADGTHAAITTPSVVASAVSAPSMTLGGVQRSTWPASGSSAAAIDDVLVNGHVSSRDVTLGNYYIGAIAATFPAITIVDHCFHLERDDTPRARGWRRRKGQSWRSEARSAGKYLGSSANATAAVAAGGVTTDVYYNTTSSAFHEITGPTTSAVTYRAGREDYPTNALITAEAARAIIWDLDGAVPSMWYSYALSLIACLYAVDSNIFIGRSAGGSVQLNFVADALTIRTAAAHLLVGEQLGTIAVHTNTWVSSSYLSTNYLVNTTVNDVAITVLPDAPLDENNQPITTAIVGTAAGGSQIGNNGVVWDATGAINIVSCDINSRGESVYASTSKVYIFNSLLTADTALTSASYILDTAGTTEPHIHGTINNVKWVGDSLVITTSTGLFRPVYNRATPASSLMSTTTSTYTTGQMVGATVRAIGYDSASALADKSVKTSAGIAEVGMLTKTPVSGGRTTVSGFSDANYIQEASHADWNARGALNFYDMLSGGKWGTAATLKTLISIGDGASNGSLKLEHLAANTLRLSIYNAGWTTICTSTATFTDTAEHVIGYGRMTLAGVADTCFIVVDGVIVASAVSALTISNATGYLRIGEGQDASQPWAGGQFSGYVRISATAPTAEGSKFIAAQENALNSGHACLLSNSSAISQLDYYSRSNMLAVGNGTNKDFFVGLAREGVVTTATGATVSGLIPSEATMFYTDTTNTLRVAERNVEAELLETQVTSDSAPVFKQISTSAAGVLTFPQGLKPIRIDSTAGTYVSLATSAPVFDGFLWSISGLTASTNYDCNLIRG